MLIRVGLDPKTASPSRSDAVKNETDGFQGSPVIFHYIYIYISIYTLWLFNIAMERSTIFKNGKASINEPFSMAMLVITGGYIYWYIYIYNSIQKHPQTTGLGPPTSSHPRQAIGFVIFIIHNYPRYSESSPIPEFHKFHFWSTSFITIPSLDRFGVIESSRVARRVFWTSTPKALPRSSSWWGARASRRWPLGCRRTSTPTTTPRWNGWTCGNGCDS